MTAREQRVVRSAILLTERLLDALEADYTYDTGMFKRWVTDGGACDLCEENESVGWIDEDETWPNADDVPAHPNCNCQIEEKERRYRVYD